MSDTLKKLLEAGIISQDDINKSATSRKTMVVEYPCLAKARKVRQEKADKRREVVKVIRKFNPKASAKAIAGALGVSDKTIYADFAKVK